MIRNFTRRWMPSMMACLIGIGLLNAQTALGVYQLPNPDFEEWEKGINLNGVQTKHDEPVGWNSFGTGTGTFILATSHSITKGEENGNKFAIVTSALVMGQNANGNMTTGIVNASGMTATSSYNHNYTVAETEKEKAGAPNFRQEFTGRPDALKVKMKYKTPDTENDFHAQLAATIHTKTKFQEPYESKFEEKAVGRAVISPNSTEARDEWKEFVQEFDYTVGNEGNEPAYILINIGTNQKPGVGTDTDSVWVDDLYMVYYSTLSDLKINGATLEGFDENITEYSFTGEAPEISAIEALKKSQWATLTEPSSYTDEEGTTTIHIAVRGNDYEASGNETVYSLVYMPEKVIDRELAEKVEGIYSGILDIDLAEMGVGTVTMPDQIIFRKDGPDQIGLTLKNFQFGVLPIGDIQIDNIPLTENGDAIEFESETVILELIVDPEAEVKATGKVINGKANIVIDVFATEINIPVVFEGNKVSEGLRLKDIKLDGASVSAGEFNPDVFNYSQLTIDGTEQLTFTKEDENNTVNIVMDGNWVYLYVSDGSNVNRYTLANGLNMETGLPVPVTKITMGQDIDGSLTLSDASEIGGKFNIGENIYYTKTINDMEWIPVGLPYMPAEIKTVADEGSKTDADAYWYTYDSEAKQSELQNPTDAFIMKLKSNTDAKALEFISGTNIAVNGERRQLSTGYNVVPNITLQTINALDIIEITSTSAESSTLYIFNGTEFKKANDLLAEVKPGEMFIVYVGQDAVERISVPDPNGHSIDNHYTDGIKVYGSNGEVYIRNFTGKAEVYGMNGGIIMEKMVHDSLSFTLEAGTYVVRTGQKATLVIVK